MTRLLNKEDVLLKYKGILNERIEAHIHKESEESVERIYQNIKDIERGLSDPTFGLVFIKNLDSRSRCDYTRNYFVEKLKEKGYDLNNNINKRYNPFTGSCKIYLDMTDKWSVDKLLLGV